MKLLLASARNRHPSRKKQKWQKLAIGGCLLALFSALYICANIYFLSVLPLQQAVQTELAFAPNRNALLPNTSPSNQATLIPNTIYITYKYDLCNLSIASHLQTEIKNRDKKYVGLLLNVARIKQYNADFNVICFDDHAAYTYLQRKNQTFADYFKQETRGMYKADLFRLFLLYHEGGYYLDADLEPILPLNKVVRANTTFTSCIADGGSSIFQAYLGAARWNPILKRNLDIYYEYISHRKQMPYNVGTQLLAQALRDYTKEDDLKQIQKQRVYRDQHIELLQEKRMV